jgi:hypothetical protein
VAMDVTEFVKGGRAVAGRQPPAPPGAPASAGVTGGSGSGSGSGGNAGAPSRLARDLLHGVGGVTSSVGRKALVAGLLSEKLPGRQ